MDNDKTPRHPDLDDREVEIEAPTCPTAEALATRITEQRKLLAAEEANERTLTVERKRLLTEGTDAETDEIERRIDASRTAQVRILERVDLLVAGMHEANRTELASRLDVTEANTHALREQGEKLIAEVYTKQAKALAATLRRLALIDAAIAYSNRELEIGGRPAIEPANNIRCRRSQRVKWTETKRVGINQPEHPAYGKVSHRSADNQTAYLIGGGQCAAFEDVKVEREELVFGTNPPPLYEAIELPSAEAAPLIHASLPKAQMPQPIFDPNAPITDAEVLALLGEQRDPEGRK